MSTFHFISCIFLNFLKIIWGLSQKIKLKVNIPSSFALWEIWFSNPFVTSRNIPKFLLFWSFLRSKIYFKSFIFFRCMSKTMQQLYSFSQFLGSKSHWEKKYFLKIFFLVSRNTFKKGDCWQFLASNIYDKTWCCFNILCNFSVLKIFGMSSVCGVH